MWVMTWRAPSISPYKAGLASVAALYFGPYVVVNVWLVLYTWLQHTDTDVPHLAAS